MTWRRPKLRRMRGWISIPPPSAGCHQQRTAGVRRVAARLNVGIFNAVAAHSSETRVQTAGRKYCCAIPRTCTFRIVLLLQSGLQNFTSPTPQKRIPSPWTHPGRKVANREEPNLPCEFCQLCAVSQVDIVHRGNLLLTSDTGAPMCDERVPNLISEFHNHVVTDKTRSP